MGIGKLVGAAAVAFALGVPAPAIAAPFVPIMAEATANDAAIVKVGYRHDKYRKFYGGISYVGDYGLRYAPSYWRHRKYENNVTINVYAEEPKREDGYRTRPLIIELPR